LGDGAGQVAPIPGSPPDLARLPAGCSFYERCPFRLAKCEIDAPPLAPVGENHLASCWVDVSGQK
jgi:oligopeptide/dipeptide ABC transporter ATP-binding protein